MNSKPFPADTSAPIPTVDPIAEGIARLHEEHKAHVATSRLEFAALAEKAWEDHLAKQKADFLQRYRDSHYLPQRFKYASLDREGQYRVSLPHDSRIEGLAKVGMFGEMLRCLLARTPGHKAPVSTAIKWFAPYMEVSGTYSIITDRGSKNRAYVTNDITSSNIVVHAENLSREMALILNETSMCDCEFGSVRWWAPDEYDESEY
jgi:hypothetical protein